MKIKRGNKVLCDAYLKNNSFTVDEIMGEQTLTLNFLSRDVIDFEVGDYVECEGERYRSGIRRRLLSGRSRLAGSIIYRFIQASMIWKTLYSF